jgi:hypothetical protein
MEYAIDIVHAEPGVLECFNDGLVDHLGLVDFLAVA